MLKPSRLAVAMAAAGIAMSAQANDAYELDRIVVSASRTAQTVDQALAPVTVITRDDIERSQASSVSELLSRTPGIQVNSNGGRGSTTSIFIRGAGSNQTLVLIDGQRVNSATGGSAEIQYLDPDQIERIEIVRGAGASLYGADAVGGIVQIFTRQGRGKPSASVKASVGNMGTHEYAINAGGQSGNTRFNIGASFAETDGFDFTNDDFTDAFGNNQNFGANLDDDGYRNKSVSANVSHEFEGGSEAGIRVSHAQGKSEYDAYHSGFPYDAFTLFNNTSVNGYYSMPVNDHWFSRLDIGYVDNFSENNGGNFVDGDGFKSSSFGTKRTSLLWQNDLEWMQSQLLTVGLDYYRDKAYNSNGFVNPDTGKAAKDSRYNVAMFVQNQSDFENSDLQFSLRQDKNETYGNNTTGKVAYGYDLPKSMRVIASYGTAFRAPTFNDLYFPDPFMIGNPNLKPETSRNAELTLKGKHAIGDWQVSVFQNDIDDMINWAPIPDDGRWTPTNVDEARIRGIEMSLHSQLMGWNINTSATFLDPKDTRLNKMLARRARQYMTIDADRQFGKWSIGGTMLAQGHSFDDTDNDNRIPGFATFDLRVGLQINKAIKTELKATNLLDKQYYEAKGYNKEPRAILASIIWTPEI